MDECPGSGTECARTFEGVTYICMSTTEYIRTLCVRCTDLISHVVIVAICTDYRQIIAFATIAALTDFSRDHNTNHANSKRVAYILFELIPLEMFESGHRSD